MCVSLFFFLSLPLPLLTEIRADPTRLRRCQGDDPLERSAGFRDPLNRLALLLLPSHLSNLPFPFPTHLLHYTHLSLHIIPPYLIRSSSHTFPLSLPLSFEIPLSSSAILFYATPFLSLSLSISGCSSGTLSFSSLSLSLSSL
jgi:hypothetical protein